MVSTPSGLDWQEASQLKPSIMPPPASAVVFKKERLPKDVFIIAMLRMVGMLSGKQIQDGLSRQPF